MTPQRSALELHEWESWARGVGLLLGDRERALFDEDDTIRDRLLRASHLELGAKLPDPPYSGWRPFFATAMIVLTITLVGGLIETVQRGTWANFLAAAVVILGLDWAWIHSHRSWRRRVASRTELRAHLIDVAARAAFEIVNARRRRTNRVIGVRPLRARLNENREELLAALEELGATNVRVFGSVARGDEATTSDLDLLVDVADGVGMFGLGQMRTAAERILDAPVDIVPASSLKPDVVDTVLREARPV